MSRRRSAAHRTVPRPSGPRHDVCVLQVEARGKCKPGRSHAEREAKAEREGQATDSVSQGPKQSRASPPEARRRFAAHKLQGCG